MRVAALLALALAAAPPLAADPIPTTTRAWTNLCTTGAFHTCASVTLTVETWATSSVVILRVRNTQGASYGYDNIGASSIGYIEFARRDGRYFTFADPSTPGYRQGISAVGGATTVGSDPDLWDSASPGPRIQYYTEPFGRGIFGCDLPAIDPSLGNDGPRSRGTYVGGFVTCGHDAGGWVEIAITIDIPATAEDFDVSWYMYGATGQAGCSTDPGSYLGACTTVTPEPVTLSLLATGLAGVGLTRRRQRRT